MKYLIQIAVILLTGLVIFCPIVSAQKLLMEETNEEADNTMNTDVDAANPIFKGKIELQQTVRDINESSRVNPDNGISDLNVSKGTLDLNLELSDYLDESGAFRWASKIKGFRTYESDSRSGGNDDDSLRFDELFLDWGGEDWFVSLGKRRNSWGPALAFNPVNVVVPSRDPLNPNQQSEGHPMLLINYGGDILAGDLIVTKDYGRDWEGEYYRWGARLSVLMDDMDFGAYYFDGGKDANEKSYNRMTGLSYSSNFLDDATIYVEMARFVENRRNYYNSLKQEIQKDEVVTKTVVGSSITIDGNTSLLIEAYHNTAGYSKEERENYYKRVDSVLKPFISPLMGGVLADHQFGEMNKDYLLISYSKRELYEKYSLTIQALLAEDGSASSEISGNYDISDYYLLSVEFKHYSGDQNSEFGNSLSNAELVLGLSASF